MGCADGQHEWDPFSETDAGRERPPENGPRLRERATRGGRSRDLSLQEGPAAHGPAEVLTELVACKPIVFSSYVTSTISVNSNDPS